MTDSLTYTYCLVRSARQPVLRGVPTGIPRGGDVRAIDAGKGVWAIVSSVPASDYGETAVARGLQNIDWVGRLAMAHEAVVEHFLTATAVLPMQLFALFTSDERVLAHITRDRARIDRIMARLDRQLEWGLRLTFDENAARQAVEGRYGAGGAGRAGGAGKAGKAGKAALSGATYLARKRDLLDVTRAQLARARSQADRLYRAMRGEATEARRRTSLEKAAPGSRLLLDAAFLVPRQRVGGFRTALRRNARRLDAPGIVVSLTGPWPPYNFIAPASRSARRRDKSPSRSALRQDRRSATGTKAAAKRR